MQLNDVFERQILLLESERIFFVERSWKSKVFYLKSILRIVSLKFLVLKKRSHNLHCFVSSIEQSCAHHILYNSELLGPPVQKDNCHNVLCYFAYIYYIYISAILPIYIIYIFFFFFLPIAMFLLICTNLWCRLWRSKAWALS